MKRQAQTAGTRSKAHLRRKRLGRFYTPEPVAVAMTSWAVRSQTDKALDPSYGGCAFLTAVASRLRDLGARRPFSQVFGVDIDKTASRYINAAAGRSAESGNFISGDFLQTTPAQTNWAVQCVVGNPPYVRHHTMSAKQLLAARRVLEGAGATDLPKTAGYWTYFLLHSLQFLTPAGRLALVLPAAFLNARYATAVRRVVLARFRFVTVLVVRERLFSDAEESSVIVLAEGFDQPHEGSSIEAVDGTRDIQAVCRRETKPTRRILQSDSFGWKATLLSEPARAVLSHLDPQTRPDVATLGSLATVAIGTVTGANEFFVLSSTEARRLGLPESALRPIIASTASLPPLVLDAQDRQALEATDARSLLFCPGPRTKHDAVVRYVRSAAAKKVKKNGHCKRRNPWYMIQDLKAPSVFVPYVNDYSPRLVLNRIGAGCTNAVHRLWWKKETSEAVEKTLALSALTSLTALSAEICGRSYGGGALKLELGELRALWLAKPTLANDVLADAFERATKALAGNRRTEARQIADETVLSLGLRLTRAEIQCLSEAFHSLRRLRMGERQRSVEGSEAVPA